MGTAPTNVFVRSMTAPEGMSFTIHPVIGMAVSLTISFTDRVGSTGMEPFGGATRFLSGADLGKAVFHPDLKFKPYAKNCHSSQE